VKADTVVPSFDNIKFHCFASVTSKRVLCCGVDSPYLLIERARIKRIQTGDEHDPYRKMKAEKGEAILDLKNVIDWVRIYQSKHIFGEKNPWWDSVKLLMTNLCSNNKLLPLRISVFNYQNSGCHSLYGQVITSLRQIEMGREKLILKNKRGFKAGTLTFDQLTMDMKPSLLKYL
jgi:hypothetical protein